LSLRTNIIVPRYFKMTFEKLYLTYRVFTWHSYEQPQNKNKICLYY